MRPEEYLRPLRALTRECVRGARANAPAGGLAAEGGVAALLPLARALASPSAEGTHLEYIIRSSITAIL